MEMTTTQADYLIGLKKKIIIDGKVANEITLDQEYPLRLRYELVFPMMTSFLFCGKLHKVVKMNYE